MWLQDESQKTSRATLMPTKFVIKLCWWTGMMMMMMMDDG